MLLYSLCSSVTLIVYKWIFTPKFFFSENKRMIGMVIDCLIYMFLKHKVGTQKMLSWASICSTGAGWEAAACNISIPYRRKLWGEQQNMANLFGTLQPKLETQMKFLVPGFGLS